MNGTKKCKVKYLAYIFIFWLIFFVHLNAQVRITYNETDNSLAITGQWFLSYQAGKIQKESFNQFFLKRGYISIEKSLTPKISGRITPDISVDREGDGEGDIELRLKYCYLKYRLPGSVLFSLPFIEFGLVHRPWLDFEEHINHYRIQGTMFLERNRIFNSADYGVMLVSLLGGEMDENYKNQVSNSYPGKYGSVAVGIYNGGGYHAIEKNTNKTIESRLTLRPLVQSLPGIQITYQGCYGKGNTITAPGWILHAGFMSWEHQRFVFTGMYFSGEGNSSGSAVDASGAALSQHGYSFFGEFKLLAQKLSIIGRYDCFNAAAKPKDISSERYIVGIAYHFLKGCKILLDYDTSKTNHSNIKDESIFELAVEVHY